MRALTLHRYGPPEHLAVEEVDLPDPKPGEVRIRVRAAAVNAVDWRIAVAEPFLVRLAMGLLRPKAVSILGADTAGEIEAVGPSVQRFKPGDAVYADLSGSGFGAFAEYVCAPSGALAAKPAKLPFDEAAAVPLAGITALQALRDHGQLQPGEHVLVHGASGGVGTFAVQIARALGAEVTAVCSTGKVEIVRSLGAQHVVDYTRGDFARSGRSYDLILGVNGYRPLWAYRRALTPRGRYLMIGGTGAQLCQALLLGPVLSFGSGRTLGTVNAKPAGADLATLTAMIEAGKVKPVIDRRYPLSEAGQAIAYVRAGHAAGKVVITV